MFDLESEIISLLSQDREMHELAILDALNEKLRRKWRTWNRVKFGNLDLALRRLELKEAIVGRDSKLEETTQKELLVGDRARNRYYKIASDYKSFFNGRTANISRKKNIIGSDLALKGRLLSGIAFGLELAYLSFFEVIILLSALVIVGLSILLPILISTKVDPFAALPLKSRVAPGILIAFGFSVVCMGLYRLGSLSAFLQNTGLVNRVILPPLPDPLAYLAIAIAITGLVYIWRYNIQSISS